MATVTLKHIQKIYPNAPDEKKKKKKKNDEDEAPHRTYHLKVTDEGVISLVFADVGPGIADLEQAMTPGFSTADDKARNLGFGAGMGLPNIKRVSDAFDIRTSPNGTTLTLTFMGR